MKSLRIILSGMFALICMGFYSNAVSDMQAINDHYLSNVTGQSASVSNGGDAFTFVNFVELKMKSNISDHTKNAESIIETLEFFNNLSSEMNGHPFAPQCTFIENEDGLSMDLQIGLLRMHLKSIDINGTVSVLDQ